MRCPLLLQRQRLFLGDREPEEWGEIDFAQFLYFSLNAQCDKQTNFYLFEVVLLKLVLTHGRID